MNRKYHQFLAKRIPSFIFGFSLLVLPIVALTIALVTSLRPLRATFSVEWSRHRPVIVAIIGGILIALPSWLMDGAVGESWSGAMFGALFILVAAGRTAGRRFLPQLTSVGAGAAMGALTLSVLGLSSFLTHGERVSAWFYHPNSWGAALVAATAAAISIVPLHRRPWIACTIAILAVPGLAVSGSRTAALAFVVALVAASVVSSLCDPKRRARWLALPLILLALVAVPSSVMFGARLTSFLPIPENNLLLASEELGSSLWSPRGVQVVTKDSSGEAVHELIASDTDGLARLHQRVPLASGQTYTFVVEVFSSSDSASSAGIHAFSDDGGRISLDSRGNVLTNRPPPTLRSYRVEELQDGWKQLILTVENEGAETITFRPGLAPALSGDLDSTVLVRRPMLVVGEEVVAYEGTTEEDRIRELARLSAVQRFQYIPIAFEIIAERPLFGHGSSKSFATLGDRYSSVVLASSDRPTHAHSLPLDLLVRFGIVGLLGWLIAGYGLWMTIPGPLRILTVPYLAAILVSNLGDSTLMVGAPLYAGLALILALPTGRQRPRVPNSGQRQFDP